VKPALILVGALLTGAASTAAGLLLFRRLRIELYREELYPFAFVTGSALLSILVFLITAARLAYTWTFSLSCAALILWSIWAGVWRRPAATFARVPWLWRVLLVAGFLVYGTFYLMHAMAPEVSPDGSAYHLGTVARYLREHGFGRHTTNMYANMPMGIEMLFLPAFAIGRHSSAAVVHFLYLVTVPVMLLNFGRRNGMPGAGATAALLFFLSPIVGLDGSSAYIDVAMAAVMFGAFALLQIWSERRLSELLVPIGLLAGFAYACKMTAFVAVPYAAGYVLYKTVRARQPWFRPVATVCLIAGAVIAPWLVKNAIVVGNPFSPFLNRWFPNPNVRISLEEDYRANLRTYYGKLTSPGQIPMEVTVRGGILQGLLGPVFLLVPIALLALRWRLGRDVLVAALVYAAPYPANVGTRFLIGPLPLIAFAMAMVLAQWRAMAPLVVLFHALASWPRVVPLYSEEYAWRFDKFRFQQAFRIEPEEDFLARMLSGYTAAKLVDQHVPSSGKVLTYGGLPEAYTRRDVLVCYQGGLNQTLCDIWAAPHVGYSVGRRQWRYRFPETTARRLRLLQTANTDQVWSVNELRVVGPAGEVARGLTWRVRARPNPWDVQLAFDNCPVTRWFAYERAKPGMFIEIDFGGTPVRLIGAHTEVSLDQPATSARLEIEVAEGKWVGVASAPEIIDVPAVGNLRRSATEDLKRFGVTHLAVAQSDFIAEDMARNTENWGVKALGEAGGVTLYRID
jgi:hypothetical protein